MYVFSQSRVDGYKQPTRYGDLNTRAYQGALRMTCSIVEKKFVKPSNFCTLKLTSH